MMPTIADSATEDEMIATFLRGELSSGRFGARLEESATRLGLPLDAIASPDITDPAANERRRKVLVDYRGWGTEESVFGGLPADRMRWMWVALTEDDLRERVLYIKWFWEQFSGGTRRPADIAERVRAGDPEVGADVYWAILAEVRAGQMPAEPILVGTARMDRLVILEGHLRVTSYLVDPTAVRFPIRGLVGVSESISEWSEW